MRQELFHVGGKIAVLFLSRGRRGFQSILVTTGTGEELAGVAQEKKLKRRQKRGGAGQIEDFLERGLREIEIGNAIFRRGRIEQLRQRAAETITKKAFVAHQRVDRAQFGEGQKASRISATTV